MAEVRRSPRAEADLDEILEYLDRTNTAAAERYAAAFEQKAMALSRFPEMGRRRVEPGSDIRSTLVSP
jgi:plasmid stabilization system protein ParE